MAGVSPGIDPSITVVSAGLELLSSPPKAISEEMGKG